MKPYNKENLLPPKAFPNILRLQNSVERINDNPLGHINSRNRGRQLLRSYISKTLIPNIKQIQDSKRKEVLVVDNVETNENQIQTKKSSMKSGSDWFDLTSSIGKLVI